MEFKVEQRYKDQLKKFLDNAPEEIYDLIDDKDYLEAYYSIQDIESIDADVLALVLYNIDPNFLKEIKTIPKQFFREASMLCDSMDNTIEIPKEVSYIDNYAFFDSGIKKFIFEDYNLLKDGNFGNQAFDDGSIFVINSEDKGLALQIAKRLTSKTIFYFDIVDTAGNVLYRDL